MNGPPNPQLGAAGGYSNPVRGGRGGNYPVAPVPPSGYGAPAHAAYPEGYAPRGGGSYGGVPPSTARGGYASPNAMPYDAAAGGAVAPPMGRGGQYGAIPTGGYAGGYPARGGGSGYYNQHQSYPPSGAQPRYYPNQDYAAGYAGAVPPAARGGYALPNAMPYAVAAGGAVAPMGRGGQYGAVPGRGFSGGFPARGGGSGYYNQRQPYAEGGPQSRYYANPAYGGGYGGPGYAPRGGFGAYPDRPYRGRGGFFRGRGGRGGGGMGDHHGRHETYVLVHVSSFAHLDEIGRRGLFDGGLPANLVAHLQHKSRFSPVRVLVVVERRFLGANMSIPRTAEDVILSQSTAKEFLNIESVLCDDGGRLVQSESGAPVAKHLHQQLRHYLTQLAQLDKPATETQPPDVYAMEVTALLKEMTSSRVVYAALVAALKEDSERSTELFTNLVCRPTLPAASLAGDPAPSPTAESAEAKPESNTAPERESGTGENQVAATAARRSRYADGEHVTIFSSAQGVQLLYLALEQPAKRQAFFRLLGSTTAASPAAIDEGTATATTTATLSSTEVFKLFFCGVLTSRLVFQCFGLGLPGVTASAEDAEPQQPSHGDEIEIICSAFARGGIAIVCGNGGSCMLTALLKALQPNFKTFELKPSARGKHSAMAQKRGRDEEDNNDRDGESHASLEAGESALQKRSAEEGGRPVEAVQPETASKASPPAQVARTLESYAFSAPPRDCRFFYAVAAAFTSGELPEYGTAAVAGDTASATADPIEARVLHLTRHIVACRAVQTMVPHFADALLERDYKNQHQAASIDERHRVYYDQCEGFLSAIAKDCKAMMVHNYGNYVIQTYISELAPRAVPASTVESILRVVMDAVVDHIFDIAIQKFASNCVERAIAACGVLTDGHQVILRLARAVLEKGDQMMMQVATNQYGNYVVRHLCEKLTSLATGEETTADTGEVAEAAESEKLFFSALSTHLRELQATHFGAGLVSWVSNQQPRLGNTAGQANAS